MIIVFGVNDFSQKNWSSQVTIDGKKIRTQGKNASFGDSRRTSAERSEELRRAKSFGVSQTHGPERDARVQ